MFLLLINQKLFTSKFSLTYYSLTFVLPDCIIPTYLINTTHIVKCPVSQMNNRVSVLTIIINNSDGAIDKDYHSFPQ